MELMDQSEEYLAIERSVGEGCFFCGLRDILRGSFSVRGMLFEWGDFVGRYGVASQLQ